MVMEIPRFIKVKRTQGDEKEERKQRAEVGWM